MHSAVFLSSASFFGAIPLYYYERAWFAYLTPHSLNESIMSADISNESVSLEVKILKIQEGGNVGS